MNVGGASQTPSPSRLVPGELAWDLERSWAQNVEGEIGKG